MLRKRGDDAAVRNLSIANKEGESDQSLSRKSAYTGQDTLNSNCQASVSNKFNN